VKPMSAGSISSRRCFGSIGMQMRSAYADAFYSPETLSH